MFDQDPGDPLPLGVTLFIVGGAHVFFSGVIDFSDVIYSFAIGSVGAIMFVLVDKYEPEGPVARILKFLVLFVSSVAIMHKLQPYGLGLF